MEGEGGVSWGNGTEEKVCELVKREKFSRQN